MVLRWDAVALPSEAFTDAELGTKVKAGSHCCTRTMNPPLVAAEDEDEVVRKRTVPASCIVQRVATACCPLCLIVHQLPLHLNQM